MSDVAYAPTPEDELEVIVARLDDALTEIEQLRDQARRHDAHIAQLWRVLRALAGAQREFVRAVDNPLAVPAAHVEDDDGG